MPSVLAWADLAAEVTAAIPVAAQWPARLRIKEADRCADVIASGADVLRARPADAARAEVTPGQVREAIVTGLAILASRPGGVGFAGVHWHADPARCQACPGPGTLPLFALPDPGKSPGAVFTPRPLADEVAAHALGVLTQPSSASPADDIRTLRVLDPFCGSGAFLLAAARYLGDALAAAWKPRDHTEIQNLCALYGARDPAMAARALVIPHCLFGADLDPAAVELAGLALQLLAPECGTDHLLEVDDGDYVFHVACEPAAGQACSRARLVRPPGPPTARLPGLRAGDSLVGHLRRRPPGGYPDVPARLDWSDVFPEVFETAGGFDAVIGNPPFLGGNRIVGTCGGSYREHLVTAIAGGRRTTADLAVYCWLRAHELVHGNGVTGVVAPDGLLRGNNARLALGLLEQRGWRIYRQLTDRPWPARSAAVRICTVWTHRWGGAVPPETSRNVPERPPPAHLWRTEYWQAAEIAGQQTGLYRHLPVHAGQPAGGAIVITSGPPS